MVLGVALVLATAVTVYTQSAFAADSTGTGNDVNTPNGANGCTPGTIAGLTGFPAKDFAPGQQDKQVPDSSASQFAPGQLKGEFLGACNP